MFLFSSFDRLKFLFKKCYFRTLLLKLPNFPWYIGNTTIITKKIAIKRYIYTLQYILYPYMGVQHCRFVANFFARRPALKNTAQSDAYTLRHLISCLSKPWKENEIILLLILNGFAEQFNHFYEQWNSFIAYTKKNFYLLFLKDKKIVIRL